MEPNNSPEAALLFKYLDGTITESERTELFAFLSAHSIEDIPAFEQVLEDVYRRSFEERPALTGAASEQILSRLLTSIGEDVRKPVVRSIRPWLRVAAAAVFIIVLAGAAVLFLVNKRAHGPSPVAGTTHEVIRPGGNHAILQLADGRSVVLDSTRGNIVQNGGLTISNDSGRLDYEAKGGEAEYHTLSTPRGGQYKVRLPDGTDVWLNAVSSITYPTVFTGDRRKVTVTGEAYFEVAKDKSHPFIVDVAGGEQVEVLGTSFNINAYADEPAVHTTLLEGSVRVSKGDSRQLSGQGIVLTPGQQARLGKEGVLNVRSGVNLAEVLAWKKGYFFFDNDSLPVVMRQLARWYNIEVEYPSTMPALSFGGEIGRGLTLDELMDGLSRTAGINYTIEGHKLIIHP